MKTKRFYPVVGLFFILIVALVQLGISCKKNDNNNTQDCSVTQKGLAGTYMVTKVEAQLPPGSSSYTDITNQVFTQDCLKDNTLTLNADGTATYNDAGTQCSPSASTNGTWTVDSQQQITFTLANSPLTSLSTGTVSSYDCKTLVLTFTMQYDFNSIPVSLPAKATLTKQ